VTPIFVRPIHDAQVVRGDDGMEHVEYDLLVVNVFDAPVTLSSVTVLDHAGKALMQIGGDALAAATQTLFDKMPTPVVPASAAVSVDVDLILKPGAVPERVTHRIAYTIPTDSQSAPVLGATEVDGPEVAINRRPATVIKPPLKGDGWLATTACCAPMPNPHRSLRVAVDGRRIETGETFAVDWAQVKGDRIYDGDGSTNEQFYNYGADVLAVADGTVVFTQDGKPAQTPGALVPAQTQSDVGGNKVVLKIAPKVFAVYEDLQPGSLTVKDGDEVKAGKTLAKLGNTGPSTGPHLHFGLLNSPDVFTGRALPFVIDRYTLAGTVDFGASQGDTLAITPDSKQVRSSYPLYGSIQNYP
jgi:Peptidase family M23